MTSRWIKLAIVILALAPAMAWAGSRVAEGAACPPWCCPCR
jgi:hypothetical protein